jgi:NTE family protein
MGSEKKKLGIVLSGGGARGFAHLGVLQALEEMGVTPDII